jgi:uncharacterized membrane protein
MTAFFILSSSFTVLFGGMDLLLSNPRFFRLEPFVHNFFLSLIFFATAFTRYPIIRWFVEGLPKRLRLESSEATPQYLKNVTFVWALYFLLKAFLYLYLGLTVDLGKLILYRSVIGSITIGLLMGGEMVYRKVFRRFPLDDPRINI